MRRLKVESEVWNYVCVILGALAFSLCLVAEFLLTTAKEFAGLALYGSFWSLLCLGVAVFRFGFTVHPETFRFWQPFYGGVNFVLMQMFGWLFYGVSLMVLIVLRASFEQEHKPGTVTALGCLTLASALLLRASITVFDPAAPFPWLSGRLITRSNAVVVLGLIFACAQSVVIDIWKNVKPYETPLYVFTLIQCGVCQGLTLYHKPKNSQWWAGGFYFMVLQGCGVGGLVIAAYLHYVILSKMGSDTGTLSGGFSSEGGEVAGGTSALFPGLKFAVTFLTSVSIVLQIFAHDCFDSRATRALFRRARLSVTTAVLLSLSFFLFIVTASTGLIGSTGTTIPSWLSPISALLQFVFPPLIHGLAAKGHPHYRLWQPFVGGPRFVILSALGWATFSLTLLATFLIAYNQFRGQWLVSGLTCAGTFVIAISLSYFDSVQARNHIIRLQRTRDSLDDPDTRSHAPLSGELLTSCLFSMSGLLLFGVAEHNVIAAASAPIPRPQLILFGSFLLVASVPLAQKSGCHMHPTFKFFQPFSGGPDFIALQAVGWSLFSIMLLLLTILGLNVNFAPETVGKGVIFTTALFGLGPYCCIILSLYCYRHTAAQFDRRDSTSTEAILQDAARLYRRAETLHIRHLLLDLLREHDAEHLLEQPQQDTSPLAYMSIALGAASFFGLIGTELLCFLLSPHLRWAVGMPLCVVSVAGSLAAGVNTHAVVGRKRFPGYHLWQPFVGGYNFVLLQTFGWTFLSLQLAIGFVLLFSTWAKLALGYFVLLACCGFTGDTLLLLSLSHYQTRAEPEGRSDHSPQSFLRQNAEWGVGAVLTFCGVLLFVVAKLAVQWDGDVLATAPAIFLSLLAFSAGIPLALISVWKNRSAEERAPSFDHSAGVPVVDGDGEDDERHSTHSPPTMLSEMLMIATLLLFLLVEAFSFDLWLVYIGCAALLFHGGAFMVLLKSEQRNFRFIANELKAESCTLFLYSLNVSCTIGWLYVCFGLLPRSLTTFACYVAVTLLSSENRLSLPLAKAVATVTFLHGLSVLGETRTRVLEHNFILQQQQFQAQQKDSSVVKGTATTSAGILATVSSLLAGGTPNGELSLSFWNDYAPVFLSIAILCYCYTYQSGETIDGSRTNGKLRGFKPFWDSIAHYFSFEITSEYEPLHEAPAEGGKAKEIFCFHPHGVCPYTCLWAPLSSAWRTKELPNFVIIHVASALLAVPLLRDFLLCLGVVDVSQAALDLALERSSAVLLVPGGTAEMLVSARNRRTMRLIAKQKGVFLHALLHGASLVPVINFGETELFSTLTFPAVVQSWLMSTFGPVYLQMPIGRLLLPHPHRVGLKMVVGKAIAVPQRKDPKPKEIADLQRQYYGEVHRLFETHKARCGYPDLRLEIVGGDTGAFPCALGSAPVDAATGTGPHNAPAGSRSVAPTSA